MPTKSLPAEIIESSRHLPQALIPHPPDRGESTPREHLQELQRRVAATLARSGYAALAFIGCDVQQRQVILYGSVPSYHLKQLAQVYAQRVDGVDRVDNRLQVQGRRPA